jgi:hypothetical protein
MTSIGSRCGWRLAKPGFLGCAVALIVSACGSSQSHTQSSYRQAPVTKTTVVTTHAAPPAALAGQGTSSTPGVFVVPQMGFASFRCGTGGQGVQPFYDTQNTTSEEKVSIQAGPTVKRNFTVKTVGHVNGHPLTEVHYAPGFRLALPFGHYDTVTFTVEQGTEARTLQARVVAKFAAGNFNRKGVVGPRYACFVTHWTVDENVSPY